MASDESLAAGAAHHLREAMTSGEVDRIAAVLADEVAFYSPAFQEPATGRETVAAILTTAAGVYSRLNFGDQFAAGQTAALFFDAVVDGQPLQVCYRLRTTPDGQVIRLDALMRPLEATQALVTEMMRRTGR